MGTVTKTLRLDIDFVNIIDDYVKLVKEIFGFDVTANSVIAGSLVNGFGSYLSSFRIFTMSSLNITPSYPGEKLPSKFQIDKIKLFLERCENYLNVCSYEGVDNEVEEVK